MKANVAGTLDELESVSKELYRNIQECTIDSSLYSSAIERTKKMVSRKQEGDAIAKLEKLVQRFESSAAKARKKNSQRVTITKKESRFMYAIKEFWRYNSFPTVATTVVMLALTASTYLATHEDYSSLKNTTVVVVPSLFTEPETQVVFDSTKYLATKSNSARYFVKESLALKEVKELVSVANYQK